MDYLRDIYNQEVEKLKQIVYAAYDEAKKEALETIMPEYEEKLREKYRQAVVNFYSDYQPIIYNRNMSMLDLMEVEINDNTIKTWFEPSKLKGERFVTSEYLYRRVFQQGYHGGAEGGGWPKAYYGDLIYDGCPSPYKHPRQHAWRYITNVSTAPISPRDEYFDFFDELVEWANEKFCELIEKYFYEKI